MSTPSSPQHSNSPRWHRYWPVVTIAAAAAAVAIGLPSTARLVPKAETSLARTSLAHANEQVSRRVKMPHASHRTTVPSGLQAAIDKTLASQPESSPSGVTLRWGKDGAVSFQVGQAGPSKASPDKASHSAAGKTTLKNTHLKKPGSVRTVGVTLAPVALGTTRLSPGPFVFGKNRVTEALGDGVHVWYKPSSRGFEQGFTIAHPQTERPSVPPWAPIRISLSYAGSLRPSLSSPTEIVLSEKASAGKTSAELTYSGLRATDAAGKVIPSHLAVTPKRVQIVVDATDRSDYPVTIDPYIAPATTATAGFTGSGTEGLGTSVALSADGQVALVGAPYANSDNGAVNLFTETNGTWPSSPTVAFGGSGGEELGISVALSADGQEALVGAYGGGFGAAYIYTETAGVWASVPSKSYSGNGWVVALSANGQVALIGDPLASSNNGAAYIYTESSGTWPATPAATFTGSGGGDLGTSVALSANGSVAIVGGVGGNGFAYIYEEPSGGWPSSSNTPNAALGAPYSGTYQDGSSVAISANGQVVLAGAPGTGGKGQAYLYVESGGSWSGTPTYTFTGSGTERLGSSVALSADGRTALLGAPLASSDNGAAYIYTESSGTWSNTPTDTFTGTSGEELGSSVALSADGQTALVGASYASSKAGAAYVYGPYPTVWPSSPETTLTGPSSSGMGQYISLSANGRTALLGAPYINSDDGAAYIYTKSNGSWSLTTTINGTVAGAGGLFGHGISLSADGETALIGAPYASAYVGAAYVYTESGGSWPSSPTATLTVPSGAKDFGWAASLSADGETALISAPLASSDNGAAYVYSESGGSWSSSPAATFNGTGGYFGWSVSISADSGAAIVGAPYTASQNGTAYLYEQSGGSWPSSPTATFNSPASGTTDFGWSVSLSADGSTSIIGAPYTSSDNGAAYVYQESGGSWPSSPTVSFSSGVSASVAGAEFFGWSVSLSADGETALVADVFTSLTSSDGAADVYTKTDGSWPSLPTAALPTSKPVRSVTLSADGETAIAGAPAGNGAAYIYNALGAVGIDGSGSQVYGSSSPTFSYTAAITPSSISVGGSSFGCTEVETGTAVSASLAAGSYALDAQSCSGVSLTGTGSSNYVPVYSGTFAVAPAPLTITASSATVTQGEVIPTIEPTYSGFVLGQGPSALATQPTCSTTATSSSPPGNYPSTCSGAVDGNYDISYIAGTVTIKSPPPAATTTTTTTTTVPAATTTTTSSTTTTTAPTTTTTTTTVPAATTTTSSTTTTTTTAAPVRPVVVWPRHATTSPPPNAPPPPSAALTHPNGALVRFGGTTYVFAGGRAFPVPQKELAKLRGVDHAVVMAAGGSPAPQTSSQLAPGTLLTAQHVTGKPAIYVVAANGELYGFAGPRQLRDGGFDPALVVTVPSLSGLTVARQSAGAAHLDAWSTRADGALVVSGREDYVLAGGRALHVPGQSSLSVIRKADGAKAVPGTVTKREALAQMANGTLVSAKESGYAGVYVAFDGEMFAFSSLGQLDAEGYGGTAAVPVPPASVASGW